MKVNILLNRDNEYDYIFLININGYIEMCSYLHQHKEIFIY